MKRVDKYIFCFFVIILFNFYSVRSSNNYVKRYDLSKKKSLYSDSVFAEKSVKIKEIANNIIKHKLIPRDFSGSFLIALDGKVVMRYASGKVEFEEDIPISPDSAFHIASTTKTFTAMAVLKLHQESVINIYDYVSNYLEHFPYEDIKIIDLLSHTSGLIDYEQYIDRFWSDKNKIMTNEDLIDHIPNLYQLKHYQPGKKFVYSNTNYVLLASLIARVTGKSYEQYLKQEFFDKLGMNKTFVYKHGNSLKQVSPSYYSTKKPFPFNFKDATVGDKGIYSTVNDLLKWDQALYDTSFFPDSIYNLAFSPHSRNIGRRSSRSKTTPFAYGLGWRLKNTTDAKNKIIYHNGWWHGNKSMFVRRPSDRLTLIALSNKYTNVLYSLNQVLYY